MKRFYCVFLFTLMLCASLYAQKTVINVPSDLEGEGNLNNAIQAAIDGGTLSNTIFMLEPYGYYIIIGTIIVPQGEHLEIQAPVAGVTQLESPPQILWTSSGGVDKTFMMECYGDLTMKNVWLLYADVAGAQVGCSIQFFDDPVANESGKGEVCVFENVIIDYSPCPQTSSGGSINVAGKHFKGTFTNCYWKNCIDTHLRYYGRAVSFPYQSSGWHYDYLLFENCTFANMGYVLMQEGGEYGDNIHFNHCTFLNVMMFCIEQGWLYKTSVTNSIFVNTFMFGDIPAQRTEDEFNGGTIRIDSTANFGFEVPFADQDRRILFANNSYFVEQWLVSWMYDNPYSKQKRKDREPDMVPVPQPFLSNGTLTFFDSTHADGSKAFPYMNRASLYDATDPGFVLPPTALEPLKTDLYYKWSTNLDTNWAWFPENSTNQLWPLVEDLAYTNETLKTAGMGGFPLGDLYHWWPEEYTQWQAQEEAEHTRLFGWLENGVDPSTGVEDLSERGVPSKFTLSQNYPNPFNPTTHIKYSVPSAGNVSLKVYNSLGQEVATLFEGTRQAGNYIATFDGTGFNNGVYYYRLQSKDVAITKKFVFMK